MGKFQIPRVPGTTNKTIRFPNDVIEQVEAEIVGTGCTFSAFVIAAVKAALDVLHEIEYRLAPPPTPSRARNV